MMWSMSRPKFSIGNIRRVQRTDKIMVLCASFLLGLLVARLHTILPGWFVVVFGCLAISLRKNQLFHLALLGVFGLSLGVWRGGGYLQSLQPYQEFAGQKVRLQARVTLDAVYGPNKQLSFEVSDVNFQAPRPVSVPGVIKVNGFGELAVYRGDVLEITGKLYPTRGGKQATMSYTSFRRVGNAQTWIDVLRRKFVAGMQTALPEPAASFGLGLLIGQRNTLPFAISQAFLMVGLTHIVAVSGYNLTILLDAARRGLASRSKFLTTVAGLSLMIFFLLFTGASPSIVRASVVSGLSLAAWYYGRTVRPMVLIFLTAALTTYAAPTYFWSDIGWWLSILAFFGIIVLAPLLKSIVYKQRKPHALEHLAIDTLCAEIMTIPLILFIFGQVSFIGLVANMLIVLLVPLAMALSFIAALAGMFLPLLAGWFAWPAKLLLTYMLDSALLLSRVPHIFQNNTYISAIDMIVCYGLVLALVFGFRRRPVPWFETLQHDK